MREVELFMSLSLVAFPTGIIPIYIAIKEAREQTCLSLPTTFKLD